MQPQPNDRELFDAAYTLRGLYARRGVLDREGNLSVDAAVVYGEALFRIARRRDEQAARRKAQQPG